MCRRYYACMCVCVCAAGLVMSPFFFPSPSQPEPDLFQTLLDGFGREASKPEECAARCSKRSLPSPP